jgi:RNA polymerase sigma-70 factor (ECF subfamily)
MQRMDIQPDTRLASASIVQRMAAGDQDALVELMGELGGPAYSLALRMTRDVQLAEEAVQDAFVALWRAADSYEPHTASVATWVLGVVRNKAIDRVRHEQRRRPRAADGSTAASVDIDHVDVVDEHPSSDPLAAAWMTSQSVVVNDALSDLSAAHREVLELAYFDGRSQAEIASALGVPLGTVKTRTLRALARLRDVLAVRSSEGDIQ